MSPKFTSPAVVEAVYTLDRAGLPVDPAAVAAALQTLLSALVKQGYEVLGVTALPTALLCTAVQRDAARVVRWYGCEGFTCEVGRHTLACPNIDQSG